MHAIYFIVFLPLAAALAGGLANKALGTVLPRLLTTAGLFAACALSWSIFLQFLGGSAEAQVYPVLHWVQSGTLTFDWELRVDTLTAVMLVVITSVSALVHLYSWSYMAEDPDCPRFFAYLSLFTFAMLMLVTANNLVQMFFGWEGVGLASYLLIGFWFRKPSASAAAIKAFVVNRVGDLGFMLGIFGTYLVFGTVSIPEILHMAPSMAGSTVGFLGYRFDTMTILCILLFIGAMGKSAQLGLHTWLPDAMEGPTPVSALIHAATMVTAGVFMVCRLSPMFATSETASTVVTYVGAATCFFAATIGTTQWDIKRVIAYSTCSQLGYMFVAAGVGAPGAAMFHLFTHAFFKALLFLGAGSVIHAMSEEQDIRKMGGIWKKIPITYAVMWIGSLALAGVPLFAGYYSKDAILEGAMAAHSGVGVYAFTCGALAAFLTAFYSWRLIILTFHGAPRADHHTMEHVHESPWVMLVPLLVLSIGAITTGFVFAPYFIGDHAHAFWGTAIFNSPEKHMMEALHHAPEWVPMVVSALCFSGISLAFLLYMVWPNIPARLAASLPGLYRFLLNKWYFDELYDRIFVQPAQRLANVLWKTGDTKYIDGMPNGAASLAASAGRGTVLLQSGRVASYAFAMILGLVAFIAIFLLGH